jgi:hypothetical protein
MPPLVLIVFAPVVVAILAFAAILLGAASTGAWEAVEERAQGRVSASGSTPSQASPQQEAPARAA